MSLNPFLDSLSSPQLLGGRGLLGQSPVSQDPFIAFAQQAQTQQDYDRVLRSSLGASDDAIWGINQKAPKPETFRQKLQYEIDAWLKGTT